MLAQAGRAPLAPHKARLPSTLPRRCHVGVAGWPASRSRFVELACKAEVTIPDRELQPAGASAPAVRLFDGLQDAVPVGVRGQRGTSKTRTFGAQHRAAIM